MKSINNKIKKPFISIGFGKNGKISINVDLNKTNILNNENLGDLSLALETVIKKINTSRSRSVFIKDMSNFDNFIDETQPKNNKLKQPLAVINEYEKLTNQSFYNVINIDDIMKVEVCIRNNRKLQAIKEFKKIADCGLKDGKDFVDWYGNKLKIKFEYYK